jgi:PAS domain S-box-containing protein
VDELHVSRFDRLLTSVRHSFARRYGLAIVVVALALALRLSLDAVWGARFPLTTFYAAVMLAAWCGGLGAGLLATVVSAAVVELVWVVPLREPHGFSDVAAQTAVASFVAIGAMVSTLSEAMHRARARAVQHGTEMRRQMVERARAEESLRFLAALIEGSGDAIIGTTLDGTVTSWNPGAARMFGWRAAEMIGAPSGLIVPPDRVYEEAQVMERIRRGTPTRLFDTTRITRDGHRIDVSLTASPIRDARGAVVGVSKIARDITEHRRVVRALREREAELSAIAARLQRLRESNIIGVVESTEDGRITDANDAFLDMVDVSRAELLGGGLDWRRMTPPEHLAADEEGIRQAITDGACVPYEKEYVRPDGTRVPVLIGYASLTDEPHAYIGFVLNLTTRKRLEEELRRRNEQLARDDQRKDEFLAVLSHELRTPLTAMLGWARLLRMGRLDAARTRQGLETIERNTWMQARLIDDLLDVSRIVAGKFQLDHRPVDLVSVVADAVESQRRTAEAGRVVVSTALDPSAARVLGDTVRLEQVVGNLVSNALKFTPPDGRVDVRLERTGTNARITVSDTGGGIEPDVLPHVFDRFRQADSSATRRHGGLGLGLAIVRHLVELHGGCVRAESAGTGQGATFTVELPLLSARPERGELVRLDVTGPHADQPPRLDGVRILVVDDHPDTRHYLELVLESAGAVVAVAASTPDALARLRETETDVLLSDLGMPGADGFELMRAVRDRERRRGDAPLPAVALTAYASGEDRARALEAGFDLHVVKPLTPRDLVDAVVRAVRLRRTVSRRSSGRA